MSNTHALPDTFAEQQSVWGDLGPPVIVALSGLTVPPSSLTFPAVSGTAYVLAPGPPARLVYVSQPGVSLTLAPGDGTYWLAMHTDLSTPVSGWTRRAGSHFLWQQQATQPVSPANTLVFSRVTVAGGVITAVTAIIAVTGPPMSQQSSNAVAIRGGSAALTQGVASANYGTENVAAFYTDMSASGGSNRFAVQAVGTAPSFFAGPVGFAQALAANEWTALRYNKTSHHALSFHPTTSDTGGASEVIFYNIAGGLVGSILSTATTTAYNTTSDVRLKRKIQSLLGGVEALQRLRPVSFVWNSTEEPDIGFLAHELMTVAPNAVTGQPDEVNPDGSVKPQQVDQSKLVPILVAAVKELLARVEVLEQALA